MPPTYYIDKVKCRAAALPLRRAHTAVTVTVFVALANKKTQSFLFLNSFLYLCAQILNEYE